MKTETKKFKCPYCNKEYKTSWRLRSHLILKHDRNYNVIFVLLAIIGLVLTLGALLYSDQIKYLWDKHIFHKEPYVTISLNQIMLMENPYGFIDISNETGVRLHFDCIFYETCMIYKNESSGQLQLLLGDNSSVDGIMTRYQYEYPNGTIEKGCIFNYPLKMGSLEPNTYKFSYWFPLDEAIELRDSGCPYSDGCILGTFNAHNFGNKKLTDFKSEVCIDGKLFYTEGDIKGKGCMELRSENFLPDDKLTGLFYSGAPATVTNFYAYDETNGPFPEENLIHVLSIIFPNCS